MNTAMTFTNQLAFINVERTLKNLTCKVNKDKIKDSIIENMRQLVAKEGYAVEEMYDVEIVDVVATINKVGFKTYTVTFNAKLVLG